MNPFCYLPAYVLRFGSIIWRNLSISSWGASKSLPAFAACTAKWATYRNSGASSGLWLFMKFTASLVKRSVAYTPCASCQAGCSSLRRSYPENSPMFSYWKIIFSNVKMGSIICTYTLGNFFCWKKYIRTYHFVVCTFSNPDTHPA